MTLRYPLAWPASWLRTPAHKRQSARFEVWLDKAYQELTQELRLLDAFGITVTSNIPVRVDGQFYVSYRPPLNPGIAVYFQLGSPFKPKPHVLACDLWLQPKDNLRAVGLHVAALRGINRWGVGSAEQAFMGYQALPAADNNGHRSWWEILKVDPNATPHQIKSAYRHLARQLHPDAQGSHEQMAELNLAWEQARKKF